MTAASDHSDLPGEDWVLVGTIAGAFGVRGEVKVNPTTDFPERFKKGSTIYAGPEHRPMTVTGARLLGERVALRVEGVAGRESAQALFGTPLYVPRTEVVPLPEGRYYHDEILGLQAVTTTGQVLGTIAEILVTGSNDVYVARDGKREVLIPALKDIVVEIDVPGGRLVVDPVDGLL